MKLSHSKGLGGYYITIRASHHVTNLVPMLIPCSNAGMYTNQSAS